MNDSREFFGDVVCAVWRAGGNSDAVDPDRVESCRLDGREPDECAARFMRREYERAMEQEEDA